MRTIFLAFLQLLAANFLLTACSKDAPSPAPGTGQIGTVSGRVTDAAGKPLAGIEVVIEHTVWHATYVLGSTDNNGNYTIKLPAAPAGSWTAKAKVTKAGYGQEYVFDLAANSSEAFTGKSAVTRNFTWKLHGKRESSDAYYGAHVDLYQFGTDVVMDEVILEFLPYPGETTLIDGSPVSAFQKKVRDVAGTFMVDDVPVGKYLVRAVHPAKTLYLKNRHVEGSPATEQTVVFGKNGYLAETEYNIEFFLSE